MLGTASHEPQDHGSAEQEGQSRSKEGFVFVRNVGPHSLNHDVLLNFIEVYTLISPKYMNVSKYELFDRAGEEFRAIVAIQELRNLESRSLCFSDPSRVRLDHVYSGARLMDLAMRQPPPGMLKSGTGLDVQEKVVWITLGHATRVNGKPPPVPMT